MEPKSTDAAIRLETSRRRLPVGEIELRLKETPLALRATDFAKVLRADQFRVRGLSVRNRTPGLRAPLICVGASLEGQLGIRFSTPATVFLRLPASLAEIAAGSSAGSLELYNADTPSVVIDGAPVPLETDLTT